MRYALQLILASSLFVALPACFGDTPAEPTEGRVEEAAIFGIAGSAVGNITDLGKGVAYDVNSNGQIVGHGYTTDGYYLAASWQNGTVTELGLLPGGGYVSSNAAGVNDAGEIVGGSGNAEFPAYSSAFVWRNGTMTELPKNVEAAFAEAINIHGQIVGSLHEYPYERYFVHWPALWQNGVLTGLGSLGGGEGEALDINDNGQVVGWSQNAQGNRRAFLWQNGSMRDIGTLGGPYSVAQGINNLGQVVGESKTSGQWHAFRWNNGAMKDLGTLGGTTSSATDINDKGQIVGYSLTSSGETHAFVWQAGAMTDLGTLGGGYAFATAINPSGLVVGGSRNAAGETHAMRWTIPTNNFWSFLAPLRPGRRSLALTAANGLLYSIGGNNTTVAALTTVQAYNPNTSSWSQKSPLPAGRQNGNGAAAINGTIYVAGGQDAAGMLTRTLYAYNPSTNSWATRAAMPAHGGCGGSAVIAGKLYVFSGCKRLSTGASDAAGMLHRYDPSTNSWTTLRSAPVVHVQPAVAAIGGKLYVAGGNNGAAAATRRLDVYDPATNTWTTRQEMPTARVAMGAAVAGGRLYVVGGRSGTTYLNTVETYDPVTNSWTARPALPTARAGLAVAALNNLVHVVGGRNAAAVLPSHERFTP